MSPTNERFFVASTLLLWSAILGLGISAPVGAAPAAKKSNEESAPLEFGITERVKSVRLDNGLTLLVAERPTFPTVGCATFVRVGSADEPAELRGATQALEQLLLQGTSQVGAHDAALEAGVAARVDEIHGLLIEESARGSSADSTKLMKLNEQLQQAESEEAALVVDPPIAQLYEEAGGRSLRSLTSYDVTAFALELPAQEWPLFVELESKRLRQPVLRGFRRQLDELERKGNAASSDGAQALRRELLQQTFGVEPYGASPYGDGVQLAQLTRAQLRSWFERMYTPERMTLVIVGDVNAEDVIRKVKEEFATIPARRAPPETSAHRTAQEGSRRVELERPGEPLLLVAWRKSTIPDPGEAALRVAGEILAGGKDSRLGAKLLSGDSPLARSVQVDPAFPGTRWSNLLVVEVLPAPLREVSAMETMVDEESARLTRELVTDLELERAKIRVRNQFVRELGTNPGLALTLGISQCLFHRFDVHMQLASEVHAVTARDVRRAARATFRGSQRVTASLVVPELVPDSARLDRGEEWALAMRRALLSKRGMEPHTAAEWTSDVEMTTPGGTLKSSGRTHLRFPGESLSELTLLGVTTRQIVRQSEVWKVEREMRTEPTEQERREFQADAERDFFLFCREADHAALTILGSRRVDGAPVLEVRGPSGSPFLVTLDAETFRPTSIISEGEHPLTGERVKIVETLTDWRDVGGLLRPHRIETAIDGVPFAVSRLKSFVWDPRRPADFEGDKP